MKRITEFTGRIGAGIHAGVTYIVECKHGEDLCTIFPKNCPADTWKETHATVDNMFAKEDWITSKDKLELPSKFYITTSPDETAYKYLVTETEGGNYNITSSKIVAWWKWERVEANILAGIWTYFPIESASSFETGCTTQKDFLELPDKFYFTVNNSNSKWLATATEDGLFFVLGVSRHGKGSSGYWTPEDMKKFLLSGELIYAGEYKQEKIQGLKTNWIIVDEMNELENTIAKWQSDNPEKPVADDFYFKAPCDCGSCFPKTLYRAERMQRQLSENLYQVTWWDDELKEHAEGFYSVEEVQDNIKKQEWVVVECNGTDANGFPLNFTKDMLKPYMRFRTGNNGQYIAVESEVVDDNGNINVRIIGASGRAWTEFELVNIHGDDIGEEYRAMSIYEKPKGNDNIVNPDRQGKLIWKANK